jgi:hypothetical protein
MKKKNTLQNLNLNQFDQFWEITCPDCGKTIDLEVLVNVFQKKRR